MGSDDAVSRPATARGPGAGASSAARRPGPLRRFFLLEDAVREAQAAGLAPGRFGHAEFELAHHALECAQLMAEYPGRHGAALLLLREATRLYVSATIAGDSPELAAQLKSADGGQLWEAYQQAIADEQPWPEDEADQLKDALLQPQPERIAPLSAEQRECQVRLLLQVAGRMDAQLAPDVWRLARLRELGRFRIVVASLLGIALLGAGWMAATSALRGSNLALGRTVTISSSDRTYGGPTQKLVDDDLSDLGMHSEREAQPWARVDLGAVHDIHQVVIHNRLSCCQERAVPMVIEVSTDGKQYQQLGKRTATFSVWALNAIARARFVRVRVLKTTFLHINEIAVY